MSLEPEAWEQSRDAYTEKAEVAGDKAEDEAEESSNLYDAP